MFTTINKEVGQLDIPNLITSLTDNKKLDFSGNGIEVNFDIGQGDGCSPFTLQWPNRNRTC
jgi:hypothetical protein